MVTGLRSGDGSRALDALGEVSGRDIVDVLRNGSCSDAQIVHRLLVSRPAVSRRLRFMRHAGRLDFTSEEARNAFRLCVDCFRVIQAYVRWFWDHALAELELAAEGDATAALPGSRAVSAGYAEITVAGAE